MPEEAFFDESHRAITVCSWGHVTLEDMIEARNEVLRLADKHNVGLCLIDARAQTSVPSDTEKLELVKHFQSSSSPRLRVALVPGDATYTDNRALETFATNRGENIKLFDTIDEARAWLQNGHAAPPSV